MTDILLLARKDLKLLLRDRSGFFFTFFWPVIMAMFFGSIFGGGGSGGSNAISLMLVDEDGSSSAERLIEELRKADEIALLDAELSVATDNVRRGAVPAYLLIPEGFGAASTNRFITGAPRVELVTDPSRMAEAGMLEGLLQRAGASLLQSSFTDTAQVGRMVDDNLAALEDGGEFEGRGELAQFLTSLKTLTGSGVLLPQAGGGDGGGF